MNNDLIFFNTIKTLKNGYFLNRSKIRKDILNKDNLSYINFKSEYHDKLNKTKKEREKLLDKATLTILNILNLKNNTDFDFITLQQMLIMLINDEFEIFSVNSLIKYHLLFKENNNEYKNSLLCKKINSFYLSNQYFVA
jgi:hypothetical protein